MVRLKIVILLLFLCPVSKNVMAVKIKKALIYNRHTLADSTIYKENARVFQWGKISEMLDSLALFEWQNIYFGILRNYKNIHGAAPLARNTRSDSYQGMQDSHGVSRYQSVPLYCPNDPNVPERYGRDGSLVSVLKDSAGFVKIKSASVTGIWLVPQQYLQRIGPLIFRKVIFVDRTNQNIATLERSDSVWWVRSMNPVTTGLRKPPYMRATPLGIFVIQKKIPKMIFHKDGTTGTGGFAPYASRFSNGAYLHGIPVNDPNTKTIEYSSVLGTTPRSHMCVRNATSHAEFIYQWATINETLVFVIE